MSQSVWDVPRTEEGLQEVQRRLAEFHAAGDDLEVGNGLLALDFLVKWVPCVTPLPPFIESRDLSLQALEFFRRAKNEPGQVRALVAATAMVDPETRETRLSEAEQLAEKADDENLVAMVIAARGRALGGSNRPKAAELTRQALAIYRRQGNHRGVARCLFSLAVQSGDKAERRDAAMEAAQIHRALGDRSEAARCITIVLWFAKELDPPEKLEALAHEGLEDAISAGDRNLERGLYNELASITEAAGRIEEAEKFRRMAERILASDGLTPLERWQQRCDSLEGHIATAKTRGAEHSMKVFQTELNRLREIKPI